jgi:predicted DsbA family dithiol-disulfide isomerase
MLEKFRHAAEECGLPFAGSRMIYNTRAAQELRAWAHEKYQQGAAFEAAAFASYFVAASNLAQPAVLLAIVRDLDLPEDEARDVLRTRSFSERVDRDLAQAKTLGIMSAPTFMAHGKRLVGSHPLSVLKDFAMGKALIA